jgi:hypothetical protein
VRISADTGTQPSRASCLMVFFISVFILVLVDTLLGLLQCLSHGVLLPADMPGLPASWCLSLQTPPCLVFISADTRLSSVRHLSSADYTTRPPGLLVVFSSLAIRHQASIWCSSQQRTRASQCSSQQTLPLASQCSSHSREH